MKTDLSRFRVASISEIPTNIRETSQEAESIEAFWKSRGLERPGRRDFIFGKKGKKHEDLP